IISESLSKICRQTNVWLSTELIARSLNFSPVEICRQIHFLLSTDPHRPELLMSGKPYLSTASLCLSTNDNIISENGAVDASNIDNVLGFKLVVTVNVVVLMRMRRPTYEKVLIGRSCLLMMGRVAWGGYNHGVSQRACSEASGDTFRAATTDIFRNHFSLACSPQSGMGIVYVKHRTNRMRINFSSRLSNNKGWTGRLFSVGRQQGANIPEWDFPVRVVEPLRRADMPPFLIREAAVASQLLNTVGVNHAEGYLTEYKLVKCKLSRAWDDEEIAAGRDQKEMAGYAETIPVSLCTIRLDGEGFAKGSARQAKAVTRGGAMKKALEMATTAEATSLPQTKRKEKRKAAMVELQAGGRSSEEGVSDEPRVRKKKKITKLMPYVAEGAAVVEGEAEEDLEPLLTRRSCQPTGTSEERASATPAVDRSEAVMKMSAELGLIMRGKTIAGEDEDLQDQKRIRGGAGEDRGNPPMPKSVESLEGRGFRNTKMCSREEENVPSHGTVPVSFIGVDAKANVRNVGPYGGKESSEGATSEKEDVDEP
ncbi:hypothetical protein Taro_025416, partial [Colocasia esculenta]|nr:hypothetical protein [Colocasia esculenta]